MSSYNDKQKELLVLAIEKSTKALAKIVTSCLKEKQTEAAQSLNEDIQVLMDIKKGLEKTV